MRSIRGLSRYLGCLPALLPLWAVQSAAQTVVGNTTSLSPLFACTNATRLGEDLLLLPHFYCSVTQTTLATGLNQTCRLDCDFQPCSIARLTAPLPLLPHIMYLDCEPGNGDASTAGAGTAMTATGSIGTVPPSGTAVNATLDMGVLVGGVLVQAPGDGQSVAIPISGSLTIPGNGGVSLSFGAPDGGAMMGRRRLQQTTTNYFGGGGALVNINIDDGGVIRNSISDLNTGYVSPGSRTNLILYNTSVYPGTDPPVSVIYANITFPKNVTVQSIFLGNPTVGKGSASSSPYNTPGILLYCYGPSPDLSNPNGAAFYMGTPPGSGVTATFVPTTPTGLNGGVPVAGGGMRASTGPCTGARLVIVGGFGNYFTAQGQGSSLSIGAIKYTID